MPLSVRSTFSWRRLCDVSWERRRFYKMSSVRFWARGWIINQLNGGKPSVCRNGFKYGVTADVSLFIPYRYFERCRKSRDRGYGLRRNWLRRGVSQRINVCSGLWRHFHCLHFRLCPDLCCIVCTAWFGLYSENEQIRSLVFVRFFRPGRILVKVGWEIARLKQSKKNLAKTSFRADRFMTLGYGIW